MILGDAAIDLSKCSGRYIYGELLFNPTTTETLIEYPLNGPFKMGNPVTLVLGCNEYLEEALVKFGLFTYYIATGVATLPLLLPHPNTPLEATSVYLNSSSPDQIPKLQWAIMDVSFF